VIGDEEKLATRLGMPYIEYMKKCHAGFETTDLEIT
jgi:hypothetical protein